MLERRILMAWLPLWLVAAAIGLVTLAAATLDAGAQEQNAETALDQLTVAAESSQGVRYQRSLYQPNGWRLARGECDAREMVMLAEAVLISGIDDDCQPSHGAWWSWYDGRKIVASSLVDIDHMVPLAEAHASGAARWTASRKQAFANDLELEAALTAVSSSSNRSKSDRDPAEWKPPLRSAWCQYARDWIAVKAKWRLSADVAEVSALRAMLSSCARDFERLSEHPERLDFILSSEPTTESAPVLTIYRSCREASVAGLQRQRGSIGSGLGYPAAQVPSGRDGDGDGIVCER